MTTNNLKQNNSGSSPVQLQGGCCSNCLFEVCGGAYKGCGVGGWLNGDGDTTACSDCSDSRFQTPC